ncbi:casein kinase 2 regulatory subunit [Dissophora ornata]|nr:casein kinase 2 regulatory subunit [Dissophora ornata]
MLHSEPMETKRFSFIWDIPSRTAGTDGMFEAMKLKLKLKLPVRAGNFRSSSLGIFGCERTDAEIQSADLTLNLVVRVGVVVMVLSNQQQDDMEPASSDYLTLSDLSKPRRTPLEGQLEKIDPSIIKNGTPSSRSHRRGHARQRTEHDWTLFEISVLAFREIILKRLWKNDHQFQSEAEFCKRQWDILKPRRTFLTSSTSMSLLTTNVQKQKQNQSSSPNQSLSRTVTAQQLAPSFTDPQSQPQQQSHNTIPTVQSLPLQNQQRQQSQQVTMTGHPPATNYASSTRSGPIFQATQPTAAMPHSAPATPSVQPELFKERIAHLLTDQRRFHAPSAVLERVHKFFKGPPQLDPAAFEGSTLDAMIPVPFPEIMDTDGWRVPVAFDSSSTNEGPKLAPIQSCFLHVPILPSKRLFETDTELILLDDVRLVGQLNAKLWEEFSNGNVVEAISLVPTSATWFGKTELADWPCVVMSGLKFEQANGTDPSGKGTSSAPGGFKRDGDGAGDLWNPSKDGEGENSIDPQFDDIYSILPPNKKPRLERAGRPSDAQAAWHHNKRRKMEEDGFSKLKDQRLDDQKWGSDAEMSETLRKNVDDYTSGSDSDYTKYWIDWFLGTKGNEYFCEVDEEYILDRFNLTGLNTEVQYYSQALDLITDNLDESLDEEMREIVEKSARHLYGLIHARFIITTHGLTKMLEKFKKCDFGRCPRVLCHNHPLLPVALSDVPYTKSVKLFCCRCEDIYNPKSTRHASIDGAYFGCSFPHMLFQVYPQLVPPKSTDRYVPRIFGFKLHDVAKQHRYQDMIREESHARIMAGIEGLPTTAAPAASRDTQNHKTKADGNSSVATESGVMADVNN